MSPVIQFKHAFRNVSRGLSAIFCLAYPTTPNLIDNANLDIDTTSGLLDSRFIIGIKGFCVLLFSLSTYLHDVGFDHAWGVGFLATFCVSSGYVLSIQPLLYIQAGAWDKLLDTLTSYSFRRYLRLMVPSFAMVLFAFSMLWLGFYNFPRPKRFTPSLHLTANDGNHGFHDLWQKTTYSLLWPFVWTFEPTPLVRPLWSINVMYRNSMFLVCVLIAISRCRLRIRQGLIIAFMIISWRHEQMELFSALGGMLLAQLHEQGSSRESTPCPSLDLEKVPPTFMSFEKGSRVSTGRASLPFITQCISFTTCGIGICLCIGNDLLTSRPRWDNRARPFQHVGAILLVWAAGMSSFIRRLLLNRRAQYFGQRSFAIYITHDIVFRVIGQRVAATIIGESEDVILYALGTVLGLCVSIPFLILLAHAVHVYINDATIAATKSLEAICVNKNCLVIYATVSEACDTQTIKVTSSLTDAISGKLEVFGSTENSRYIHGVIDSPTSKAVAAIIWFLLPSFVSKRLRPGVIASPPKLHPTAWLDGLRGIASYSVYSCHLMYYFPNVGVPWGLDGTNKNFFQLPIVNLPSRGSTMVTIFFMISGYVLSFGALKQIRTGGPRQKLSKTISSAIFRRGPRLYLPPMAITFCTAFLAQLGLFESSYSIAKDPVGSLSGSGTLVKRERHLEQLTSFWTEFLRWINSSENMTDPFTWAHSNNYYNPHLWTINLELHGSILVYLYLITFSKTKDSIRIGMLATASLVVASFDASWGLKNITLNIVLFSLGILLAEINLQQAQIKSWPFQKRLQTFKASKPNLFKAFWWLLFVLSLYLASTPPTKPWQYPQFALLPRIYWKSFYERLGCFLLIFAISNSEQIQSLFNSSIAQYLGNISFALYIIHYTLIHTIGYRIVNTCGLVLGAAKGDFYYNLSWGIGYCITTIPAIWVADVVWRAFDIPSVKFMRWVEGKCQ